MTVLTAQPGTVSTGDRRPGTDATDGSLPDRARLTRFAAEVLLAGVTAVATSLAVQSLVGMVRVPVSSQVPVALGALGAAGLVGVLFALAARDLVGKRPRGATALTWIALSALATLPLSVLLVGTKHYIFGVSGDQSFRVQYLTRFADSARLADFAYPDLPPYYPAGWFWIGGRIADLAGMSGWEAYKPYAITTMAVAGVLAFCVWSLVVGRTAAALLALVTAVLGIRLISYEPYLWLLGAVVPPLAVLAWRLLRAVAAGAPARRWAGSAVLVGVALGAAGAVYSLLFWYVGMLLVALAAAAALRAPRHFRLASARRMVASAVLIGAVALPLVLTVWAPYLAAVLDRGFRAGAAQRFLPESGALWPLPMVEPSATGVLALAGTVWIVARCRSSDVAQALGAVVLAGYAWFALSTLALAAGTTLLAFKLEPLLVLALACAGVFGLRDAVRAARHQLAGSDRRAPVTAVVVALSFAAVVGLVQTIPQEYEWSRAAQYGDYYPTGVTPLGTADEADAGAWNDELIVTIDELTDVPPHDLVLLSTHSPLLTYRPYFAFQTTIDQYANPLANFPARRARIEQWAASSTSAELLAALDTAPMRTPSVFVLSRQSDGLHLAVTLDTFPAQPNVGSRVVVFNPVVFEDAAFQRRDVGPFTVLVRTGTRT